MVLKALADIGLFVLFRAPCRLPRDHGPQHFLERDAGPDDVLDGIHQVQVPAVIEDQFVIGIEKGDADINGLDSLGQ